MKEMRKIKIGQIGLGHNHGEGKMLAVQKFHDFFEVIGYAEENEDWVKKRSNLPCYKDLPRLGVKEVIEKSDAVLVECDVWNLTETAMRCVKAGKHVHIDKPASGTPEEFQKLLELAKDNNLTVQMGYMYRYNYAIKKCFELFKSGELGEIYQIDAEMSTHHSDEYRKWLQHFKGGSMYIFGSHLLDLILLMLGEPQKIYPFIKQTGLNGIYSDDNCFCVLEYEKAIAKITNISTEINGWGMRRFAVMGSKGTVEIKPIELDVEMYVSKIADDTNSYKNIRERIEVADVPQRNRYDSMMKEFYESIMGINPNPYTYAHEYLVQKILYEITGGHK